MKKMRIMIIGMIPFIYSSIIFSGESNMTNHPNKVANSAETICPLLAGEKIPSLNLKTQFGEEFDLDAAVSQKPTLLIFYRGGWCPYCNLHLAELQKIEGELTQMGYQIIAVSMDRPEKLKESLQKHHLKYTLLSDSEGVAAKAFGLAFKSDDDYVNKLKSYKMDLEEASGQKHHILPVPAAFLIGADGIIKFEYINPNYKVRIKAGLVLAAAKAELQSH